MRLAAQLAASALAGCAVGAFLTQLVPYWLLEGILGIEARFFERRPEETTMVIVAALDLPPGVEIRPEDLYAVQLPLSLLPGGVYHHPEDVEDLEVVEEIFANDFVRSERLKEGPARTALLALRSCEDWPCEALSKRLPELVATRSKNGMLAVAHALNREGATEGELRLAARLYEAAAAPKPPAATLSKVSTLQWVAYDRWRSAEACESAVRMAQLLPEPRASVMMPEPKDPQRWAEQIRLLVGTELDEPEIARISRHPPPPPCAGASPLLQDELARLLALIR